MYVLSMNPQKSNKSLCIDLDDSGFQSDYPASGTQEDLTLALSLNSLKAAILKSTQSSCHVTEFFIFATHIFLSIKEYYAYKSCA
jgi:hypothetical protein